MSLFSSSSWLLLLLPVCQACTVFIVGREASADGSVMVSHSVRLNETNTDDEKGVLSFL